ncbi:hypothetical protein F4808DRAFT_370186 [Astrocystis sublimbata]|nr:hypothetical protein F4808DRAFT_370186 [Astrocystis sublimbata]
MDVPDNAQRSRGGNDQNDRAGLYGSACDTCRRRRVKCDGVQPCARCARSGISCTFGSVVARSGAVGYTRYLEQKVANLEALLRQADERQARGLGAHHEAIPAPALDLLLHVSSDAQVMNMSQDTTSSFYGSFSGLNILRIVVDHISTGRQQAALSSSGDGILQAFENARKISNLASLEQPDLFASLPSQERVDVLTDRAVRFALVGHDCIDHDDLAERRLRLFQVAPENRTAEDVDSLALVYALMALGLQFEPMEEAHPLRGGAKLEAASCFHASSKLQSMSEGHTLCSIKTMIVQTKYLLSASMMSQAYVRLHQGVAIAQTMGLHVSCPTVRSHFTREELAQRDIIFATLNMMDTYLTSLLGLPKALNPGEGNQADPGAEDITLDAVVQMTVTESSTSPLVDAVCYQQVAKVMEEVHQRREARYHAHNAHMVEGLPLREDAALIADLGERLSHWQATLSAPTGAEADSRTLFAQLSIRLLAAAAQGMLYRPYLNHLALDSADPAFNMQGYEYGSRCVSAAMQAVWVVDALKSHDLLHEGHWTTTYMLTYASSILLFFIKKTKHRVTISESMTAVEKALSLLTFLARYSHTAQRCRSIIAAALNSLPSMSV